MGNANAAGGGDENGDAIERRVIEIILERTHARREEVTPEARLFDLTDSLGLTEVVMDLEDEFESSMPDEDVGKIQTVRDLVDYVKTHFPAPREKDATGP